MTKTLRVIGTLLTAVVLALNFTACGDDDDDDENGKGGTMTKEDFPGNYYVSSMTHIGETINIKENESPTKTNITNISGNKYSVKSVEEGYESNLELDLQNFDFSKGKKSRVITTPTYEDEYEGIYIKVTGQYSFQLIYVCYYDDPDETGTYTVTSTFTKSGH